MTRKDTRSKAERQEEKARCAEVLREKLSGGKITTYVSSRSRSGLQRTVLVLIGSADGTVEDISYYVARACGYPLKPEHGVVVKGCGFDAGVEIAHNLSFALTLPSGAIERVKI